ASSVIRRPFGTPAVSPSITPSVEQLDVHGAIDMLSRSSSEGVVPLAGHPNAVNPVTSGSRSLRGVAGAGMPYTASMSFGSSGSSTYEPIELRSLTGFDALNASFLPTGTTTSLISGRPSRDTCLYGCDTTPWWWRRTTFVVCRSAVVHTPIRGFAVASPFMARSSFGTWIAVVWMLNPFKLSSPVSERSPPYRRSNTRNSTKNGSSAGPEELLHPVPQPTTACGMR